MSFEQLTETVERIVKNINKSNGSKCEGKMTEDKICDCSLEKEEIEKRERVIGDFKEEIREKYYYVFKGSELESDVFYYGFVGYSNKDISEKLKIDLEEVKVCLRKILKKTEGGRTRYFCKRGFGMHMPYRMTQKIKKIYKPE